MFIKWAPEHMQAASVQAIIGEPFEWCEIPAGQFLMGTDRSQESAVAEWEPALRPFTLPLYFIAKYPVTVGQFQAFVKAEDGIRDARWWDGLAEASTEPFNQRFKKAPERPVDNINWYQAIAFCRWLSSKLQAHAPAVEVRLPTEAEWEKAARGTDGRRFPWGDQFDLSRCNVDVSDNNRTTPVNLYESGASPYGVVDMSGNVWEWCISAWTNPYQHHAFQDVELGTSENRVTRGGSFNFGKSHARVSFRNELAPESYSGIVGFRICYSP